MEWPRVFRIWKPERCLKDSSLRRRSLFRVALLRGLLSSVHRYRECLWISRTGDRVVRVWFRRRRSEEGSSDNGWFRTGDFVQGLEVAGWRVSRGGRGEKVGLQGWWWGPWRLFSSPYERVWIDLFQARSRVYTGFSGVLVLRSAKHGESPSKRGIHWSLHAYSAGVFCDIWPRAPCWLRV